MRSIVYDLLLFLTPHTGKASATVLIEVLDKWGLQSKIRAVTKENSSDVVHEIAMLRYRLPDLPFDLDNFLVL